MIAEDFSRFGLGKNIPISMFYLGATDPDFWKKPKRKVWRFPVCTALTSPPCPNPPSKRSESHEFVCDGYFEECGDDEKVKYGGDISGYW